MRKIFSKIHNFQYIGKTLFSTKQKVQIQENNGTLIIGCKRCELNHYSSMYYDKLDTIPIASKGWKHSKSGGDFFIVHPYKENADDAMLSCEELGLHPSIVKTLIKEGINNATEFQFRANEAVKTGN